jgi:hypothetical protein
MNTLNEYHLAILDDKETFKSIVDVLAQFFQDSFKDDPAGVSDWLAQGDTTPDLFVHLVKALRVRVGLPREGS